MSIQWWASLLIFISSYSPLALILFIQDLEIQGFNPMDWELKNPAAAVITLCIGIVSTLVCLFAVSRIKGGVRISVTKIENRSNELINYSLPYVVSFVGVDLGEIKSLLAFGVFFGLMFLLTVKTQSLFINPILALKGYVLYDVEFDDHGVQKQCLMLSRSELKPGKYYEVEKLSSFLHLVTKDSK